MFIKPNECIRHYNYVISSVVDLTISNLLLGLNVIFKNLSHGDHGVVGLWIPFGPRYPTTLWVQMNAFQLTESPNAFHTTRGLWV